MGHAKLALETKPKSMVGPRVPLSEQSLPCILTVVFVTECVDGSRF
jgi:hypothetical protein